jgi:predicted transposase YbfD/YdcC
MSNCSLKKLVKVDFADTTVICHETVEKSHGQIEVRKVTVCSDVEWLRQRHDWPDLKSIIMVEYTAEEGGKTRRETRFYITSLTIGANRWPPVSAITGAQENGLHWVMDMMFRDHENRIRKDCVPANFATIKHMVSNIQRSSKGK